MVQAKLGDIIKPNSYVDLSFRIVYDGPKQEFALVSKNGYILHGRVSRPYGEHDDPLTRSELEKLWGGSVEYVINENGELLFPKIKYYKTGQRFKRDITGDEYILASTGEGEANFINLETGWRLDDPFKDNFGRINSDQVPVDLKPI